VSILWEAVAEECSGKRSGAGVQARAGEGGTCGADGPGNYSGRVPVSRFFLGLHPLVKERGIVPEEVSEVGEGYSFSRDAWSESTRW